MDPGKLFQIITNSTLLATRLLTGGTSDSLYFPDKIFCLSVPEDTPVGSTVAKIQAISRDDKEIKYSIRKTPDFCPITIHPATGEIKTTATLDYERQALHEIGIQAVAAKEMAITTLYMFAEDINDNAPEFAREKLVLTVIEENDRDLPKILTKIEVYDVDDIDRNRLLFTLEGDGVNEEVTSKNNFVIHPRSGHILQIRPLDRDLPHGRPVWNLKVTVEDGHDFTYESTPTLEQLMEKYRSITDFGDYGDYDLIDERPIVSHLKRKSYNDDDILRERWKRKFLKSKRNSSIVNNSHSIHKSTSIDRPINSPLSTSYTNHKYSVVVSKREMCKTWLKYQPFKHKKNQNSDVISVIDSAFQGSGRRKTSSLHIQNNRHKVRQNVKITVKDINDNEPTFSASTFFAEIPENGKADAVVTVASAWDVDDGSQGTNAFLTYSLEKNVIMESTGERLFKVNESTGEIRTTVCCLDREATSEYRLQIVATDGGGLQGTATVVVKIGDQNDNPPRFVRRHWIADVDEMTQEETFTNKTVLKVTVRDADVNNDFVYRIIPSSGPGWNSFQIEAHGNEGYILALFPLDYENQEQRNGFNFYIEVSDMGSDGWTVPQHTAKSQVSIKLLDVNDHTPVFKATQKLLKVKEDVKKGTEIFTVEATDKDSNENGFIEYVLDDPFSFFGVSESGKIYIQDNVDREASGGPEGVLMVYARDKGVPSRNASIDIQVFIEDINDCPPRLTTTKVFHVLENEPAQRIGILLATDDDDETLGHGSPFNFRLVSPPEETHDIYLKQKSDFDDGRGGGEIWTSKALDREVQPEINLVVSISDSGGLSSSTTLTIVVDDVNDNRMKQGSKKIYVWKPEGLIADYLIGRIYVEDLDDWDLPDKNFQWIGRPNPHFSLNSATGDIRTSGRLPEGTYELQFHVSDSHWNQIGVLSNVTVIITDIETEAIVNAVSILVAPNSTSKLDFRKSEIQGASQVMDAISSILSDVVESTNVVSIEKLSNQCKTPRCSTLPHRKIWLTARSFTQDYSAPIKLRGFLELRKYQIEKKLNAKVTFSERRFGSDYFVPCYTSISTLTHMNLSPVYKSQMFSNYFQMQALDSNTTSLVNLYLTRQVSCQGLTEESEDLKKPLVQSSTIHEEASIKQDFNTTVSYYQYKSPLVEEGNFCTRGNYCLNGGRCIPTRTSRKCICPWGTIGRRCKIASRTFHGNGWLWLNSVPPCLPLEISFVFESFQEAGLLLYQGPLSADRIDSKNLRNSFLLFIKDEKLSLRLNLEEMFIKIDLPSHKPMAKVMHTVHVRFTHHVVSLMLDMCSSERNLTCFISHEIPYTKTENFFSVYGAPFQLGGTTHNLLTKDDNKIPGFTGCISYMRINNELMDLGQPGHQSDSLAGCKSVEDKSSCHHLISHRSCGCQTRPSDPFCPMSEAVTLKDSSYMKGVLSSVPNPYQTEVSIMFRTHNTDGLILRIPSLNDTFSLDLTINEGVLCWSLLMHYSKSFEEGSAKSNDPDQTSFNDVPNVMENPRIKHSKKEDLLKYHSQSVCLMKQKISDGIWHRARGGWFGPVLVLELDDGSDSLHNETRIEDSNVINKYKSQEIFHKNWIDLRTGVIIGGIPHFKNSTLDTVLQDLHGACISDLWISGIRVALSKNDSNFGSIVSTVNTIDGCDIQNFINCSSSIPCDLPLKCLELNGERVCGCDESSVFTPEGCRRMNLCLFAPCLHGGTCFNGEQGFDCACSSAFNGKYCEKPVELDNNFISVTILLPFILSILGLFILACGLMKIRQICCSGDTSSSEDNDQELKVSCIQLKEQPKILARTLEDLSECCARDDVRNYAYEGGESSNESFGSVFQDLQKNDSPASLQKVPFAEVVDLLRELPDAVMSSKSFNNSSSTCPLHNASPNDC